MAAESWAVHQKIEIPFQYTAGPAVTRFLEGLKDKLIVASVCSKCGRRSVPPLSFCGRCWRPIAEFISVSGEGTLLSFTRRAGGDVLYGMIQLEGTDSSLAHYVTGEVGRLRIGCKVAAVWRAGRTGSILDIEGFREVGN
jgi:hypothetical protein